MKLIEYESTVEKAFSQGKNKGEGSDTLCLLDIAHSLSIMAERLQLAYPTEKERRGEL